MLGIEELADVISDKATKVRSGEMMAVSVLLRGIVIAQSENKLRELMYSQAKIIEGIREERSGYIKTVADA